METIPIVGGVELPRPGRRAVAAWWMFLAAVWAPPILFVATPIVAFFVPAMRSAWIALPWLLVGLLFTRWLVRGLRLGSARPKPAPSTRSSAPRVAVLGAGPIGLATVKELLAVGAEVECFERAAGPGGVYRPQPERERGGVWPGTRLTSSPWVTAFSDFPPDSPSDRHWLHAEYLAYLERYVDAFALRPHLRLCHEVIGAERGPDDAWRVRVRDLETGRESERVYDHVAVCTGLNEVPCIPAIDGADTFTGTLEHALRYEGAARYEGKRVVIVGLGESAADIAHEIASVAERVTLSVRRGKFVIPRVNPRNGVANDYDTTRLRYAAPASMRNLYMRLRRLACAGRGDLDARTHLRMALLLASGAGPMSQPATKSDEFLDDVIERRIEIRPAIDRLDGERVTYLDQTSEAADAVLVATGYAPGFPFLEWGDVKPRHPGEMYLHMLVPELGATIAFLGFARPAIGAIPPTGELQARLFAALVAGLVPLPDEAEMASAIAEESLENLREFPTRERPNVLVSWIPYLDRLAARVGCRPDAGHLLRQPRLAWSLMSGPMTCAMYRLDGPGACPAQAAETVLSLPRMHELDELLTTCLLHFYAHLAAGVLRDPRYASATTFV